jgi:hypothetical protein
MPEQCSSPEHSALRPSRASLGWFFALAGLSVFVFAVTALSGPGRIDIVDGQTRYEVARSLVDFGDSKIRDENVWFGVFPGRDEQQYTTYRLPQSLAGVIAILAADAFGTASEARRHFFFSLTGAFFCAVLAVAYAVWFRRLGMGPRAAVLWAAAGIFCTPNWFYGTTSFDDILGAAALVVAVATAFVTRTRRPILGAALAGLLLGYAFNCKQPLGAFLPVVLAANYDGRISLRKQWGRLALIVLGLGIGIAAYKGYDWYKYPPGATPDHSELLAKYAPLWPGNPLAALLGLAFSPGAGVIWYCPTLVLSILGMSVWMRRERLFVRSFLVSSAVLVLFLSVLTFFKGDPAWGPRYLTPVFALGWVFAPAGASLLVRVRAPLFLALGFFVQILALSVDSHRLYIERGLPSSFAVSQPWLYFRPAVSHLFNRPREIVDLLHPDLSRAESFSPAPSPTFTFPVIDFVEGGPEAIHRYHVLNSFRPWWISLQYLNADERPVDIGSSAALLLLVAFGGLGLLLTSLWMSTELHVREETSHSLISASPQASLRACGVLAQVEILHERCR